MGLDENTGDGVNGYEDVAIADRPTRSTAAQSTRTINTTGMTPGLHTVRVRVGDNGALGGADNIRRTKTDTVQYLVDTPPVVNNQSLATETETPLWSTSTAATSTATRSPTRSPTRPTTDC